MPNSGEGLKRLDYRLNKWDPFLREYVTNLRRKKPVVCLGDFNVAHLDLDIYNHEVSFYRIQHESCNKIPLINSFTTRLTLLLMIPLQSCTRYCKQHILT